jgi:16S rRNA (cytidine1402-2'-O)-methyltransferase
VNSEARAGRLYVVSTPIGNMGDFSYRAVQTLRSVATILAEDTRHSRKLLDHYGIDAPVQSYHEHNEAKTSPALVKRLQAGEDLALISDAGTPVVSDPGARLIRAAIDAGIEVIPVPGASAMLAALVASGIDADQFTFVGFLPRKGKERASALAALVGSTHTVVLYEAPGRVADTLGDLEELGAGERAVAVAREMTKQYEEVRRGTLSALRAYYNEVPLRGEVVIVIAGTTKRVGATEASVRARARTLRAGGQSTRDVVSALVEELGVARNVAYRIAQEES